MFKKEMQFARRHIILTSLHHFAAGFGIALLIQHYTSGNAFLPVTIGWVLVGFSLIMHIYELKQ